MMLQSCWLDGRSRLLSGYGVLSSVQGSNPCVSATCRNHQCRRRGSRRERGLCVRNGVLRLDPVPRLLDVPVLVDEERRAGDADVGLAVVLFLAPRSPCRRDLVVRVGKQREAERVLLIEGELLVRLVGR